MISGGKASFQTIHRRDPSLSGMIHTPPLAYLHASEYPMMDGGGEGTSCATDTGLFAISWKSHLKSGKVFLRSLVREIQPDEHFFIEAQIGVKRPQPPGS